MKNKHLVLYAAMLALGMILHALTPGFLGNMKPDFLLATFFICIAIAPSFKDVIVISIACACLASLTTSLPGGEIANSVDKMITGPILFLFLKLLKPLYSFLFIGLFSFIGTLLSGTLFLTTLSLMGLLPLDFTTMLFSIVLPTAIINTAFFIVLYKSFYRLQIFAI